MMTDSFEKGIRSGKIFKVITEEIAEFKKNLYQKSADFRDKNIVEINNYSELEKKIKKGIGLFLIPFCNNLDCEKNIPCRLPAYSIRCLSLTKKSSKEEKCIFCMNSTKNWAFLGRSY